jgi:hypothetical protein
MTVGTGAVATTVQTKLRESVSVLDFGADETGVLDSTVAFNLATKAAYTSLGLFDQNFPGEVYVPAGIFKISDTVYIHKGQHLRGAGGGATKIDMSGMVAATVPVFKMGWSAAGVDAGGLPPEISEFWMYGGPDSHPVIDMVVPGAFAHDLFITSPGIGINQGGGDTIVANCIIDQGLTGILITGQNHITANVLFYNLNYGIRVNLSYDVQINNCHFEYSKYASIAIQDGNNGIQNLSISNCQFVANEQYNTFEHSINFRSNSISVNVRGCDFRNHPGFAIGSGTGLGGLIRVSDCIFNGLKTNPAYTQSTTSGGILTGNHTFEITNCAFTSMQSDPIRMSSVSNYPVTVHGCTYSGITGATSFVNVTATAGSLAIFDCVGDNVTQLVNLQSVIAVVLRGNKRWLGAVGNSGGRLFVRIPMQQGGIVKVGIKANTSPGGNSRYRTSLTVMAMQRTGYSGTDLTDYATLTTAFNAGSDGYVPAISAQIDFDSVGGGVALPFVSTGRYLVVSVPNTYNATSFEADFDI